MMQCANLQLQNRKTITETKANGPEQWKNFQPYVNFWIRIKTMVQTVLFDLYELFIPWEKNTSGTHLVEVTTTMRNPQSDAVSMQKSCYLFQELKHKCSHRDFEKGEAAEHNWTKNLFEKCNTNSWNEEFLQAHFIHSFASTLIFLSQISCNFLFPQGVTCASTQDHSHSELLNHARNLLFLHVVFT